MFSETCKCHKMRLLMTGVVFMQLVYLCSTHLYVDCIIWQLIQSCLQCPQRKGKYFACTFMIMETSKEYFSLTYFIAVFTSCFGVLTRRWWVHCIFSILSVFCFVEDLWQNSNIILSKYQLLRQKCMCIYLM